MNAVATNPKANARLLPHFGDRVFQWLTLLMAFSVFVLIVLIGLSFLVDPSRPSKNSAGIF